MSAVHGGHASDVVLGEPTGASTEVATGGLTGEATGEATDVPEAHSTPVLDIGGDVGAIVVYLGERTHTGEIEACPNAAPAARFHTGVHHRAIANGFAWTAVFPEVAEGDYHLLDDDGAPLVAVTVAGGLVTELDLR